MLSTMRRGLFLVSLPIFFINFAIPIQAKQLGGSALEIGLLFSIFTASLLVLRPIVGYGLDRIGRKPFLVCAMVFYTAAHGCYAFADDIVLMYIARFTQGIGAALLLITIDTITTDLTDEDTRPVEMGRNIETQTRSSIIGATVGFGFVGALPMVAFQYSFAFFGIATLLAFIYLALRLEETATKSSIDDLPSFEISDGLKRFMLIVLIAGFANALIQPIYLIYLQDHYDLPMNMMAWAFLPAAIVFAVLPSRVGHLHQRFGILNLLMLGFVTSGLVYLILPFLDAIIFFVILYTLSAVGWTLAEPARKALTAQLGSTEATGRTFGVAELYAGIGATIGPAIGGLIYDHHGATFTFLANGMLLILTAVLLVPLLGSYVNSKPMEEAQ